MSFRWISSYLVRSCIQKIPDITKREVEKLINDRKELQRAQHEACQIEKDIFGYLTNEVSRGMKVIGKQQIDDVTILARSKAIGSIANEAQEDSSDDVEKSESEARGADDIDQFKDEPEGVSVKAFLEDEVDESVTQPITSLQSVEELEIQEARSIALTETIRSKQYLPRASSTCLLN